MLVSEELLLSVQLCWSPSKTSCQFLGTTGQSEVVVYNMGLIHRAAGMIVILGAHSKTADENTKQRFEIQNLYSHPNYNSVNYDNDITLIKVGF